MISPELLSITLGRVALGQEEATAPRWASPLPLWSSLDSREVQVCPGVSLPGAATGAKGTRQSSGPKPPGFSGFWEPQFWKELSRTAKTITNKQIKTIAQISYWTAPRQSFISAGELLCCCPSLSRNLVITITSINRRTMQHVYTKLKPTSSCQLFDNLMRKSCRKSKNSLQFKDWFLGQLNSKKISKYI